MSIELHRRKGVEAVKDQVDACILPSGGGLCVEGRTIHPSLAVNPLQANFILAEKGIRDSPGRQEVEVDAGEFVSVGARDQGGLSRVTDSQRGG